MINSNKFNDAIATFCLKVEDENPTNKRAIFAHDLDGNIELLGFFAVLNSTEADYFAVDKDGTVRVVAYIPTYTGMGSYRVAQGFGLPQPEKAIVVPV